MATSIEFQIREAMWPNAEIHPQRRRSQSPIEREVQQEAQKRAAPLLKRVTAIFAEIREAAKNISTGEFPSFYRQKMNEIDQISADELSLPPPTDEDWVLV